MEGEDGTVLTEKIEVCKRFKPEFEVFLIVRDQRSVKCAFRSENKVVFP